MTHQRRANGRPIPQEALRAKKQERSLWLLYIILTVAVALALYGVVYSAVNRFHWKADMTNGQIFQLTDTTRDLLDSLEQDVTIINCSSKTKADSNVSELLNRYDARSPRIHVEYVDLTMNPALVEEYAKQAVTLSENGVLVQCGSKSKYIEGNDLYEVRSYTDANGNSRYYVTGFQAEAKLSSAIVSVTTAENTGVAFTAGHSETVTDTLKALIGNSNYDVDQVVLGVNDIGANVKTLVIAGARRDFSTEEIRQLDAFMANGGNLMVFRDPEVESLPQLDGYLQEWGLTVEDQVVLEPKQQMDSPLNIIPLFGASMINVYFSQQSTYLVMPECRALSIANVNGCLTNEVLRSTSAAYGKSYSGMDSLTQSGSDSTGPFAVAVTSERSYQTADGEDATQFVFLMASTGFYQDSYLKTSSLGNADFVLQVLSYMNDSAVTLNIPVKSLQVEPITVSWASVVTFSTVFVILLPLALLAAGIVQFLKRRHS